MQKHLLKKYLFFIKACDYFGRDSGKRIASSIRML